MQKINKTTATILSTKYKIWLDKLTLDAKEHPPSYRYYYDDVVMNLYKCQKGLCAYTEMRICITELYQEKNWEKGRYKIPKKEDYKRNDHFGELEHYDPNDKKKHYWNWDNLFMIHSKINDIKTNNTSFSYLKPDLPNYKPEDFFDYDPQTHRFIPNTEIKDKNRIREIQYMIDNVLCLNHGMIKNERRDYINLLKSKKEKGEIFVVDRFFTSVSWSV